MQKELNTVLKANDREAEKNEKQVVKQMKDKERRRIEKEEYLIEQCLIKFNEEVARITKLR